ncbi:MAG: Rha family transcriptional regulator [Spirochaetales bacterium]|nr:Rha family transcriptional regulator [Spirochaetales bacterium]
MSNIVKMKGQDLLVDSRVLAQEFGQAHRFTYELISNHKEQLERFGVLRFETVKPKTGRPMKIFLLTEQQSLMLLTYTRSRKETDDLREKLIREFSTMRMALMEVSLNKQNQAWLENRERGKLTRKDATGVMKTFIEYAKSQGSKNADTYYMSFSKMENAALFFVMQKFPNLRDVMDNRQLSFIQGADTIVREAIREGMEKEMFYKDIYQLAKKRVLTYSELIPKTSIPMAIPENK